MRFVAKMIYGMVFQLAYFGGLLFLPAGTWHWRRAWIFVGVAFAASVVTMFTVFRGREDLLDERLKPLIQKGQPLADKFVVLLLVGSFTALLAFIPLDVFRFHLLGRPGPIVSGLGMALIVAGWWIMALALRANTFAAPVVRHQAERNQTVINTGVYGIVRHPMYAGGVLLMLGIPLWLESYAATLLAIVPITTLVVRIRVEEEFLRRELEGYDAYAQRVRYKLIPGVW